MIHFIVGTDTDAGKTYYGKKVSLEGHRVIKPIETGFTTFDDIGTSDAYSYAKLQNLPIEKVNFKFYSQAVSPHLAAEIDGENIDLEEVVSFILNAYKETKISHPEKSFYVELAGGLLVPLSRSVTQIDLIKKIAQDTSVLIDLVVGNKLGCINHALLTMDRLINENLTIHQIVLNNLGKKESYLMKDNMSVIEQHAKAIKPSISFLKL